MVAHFSNSVLDKGNEIPTIISRIGKITLSSPLLLASGFLGISNEIMHRVYNSGAGAVVTKSISIDKMEGYRNPTVVPIENHSLINAVGLSNPGVKSFTKELSSVSNIPMLVSLVGSSSSDFPILIKYFDSLDILGYEINLSCPHVSKMGLEVGDDPSLVYDIINTIRMSTKKPVIAKIGIGSTNILKIAETVKDAGADAITAINTIRAMVIDVETGFPILSNKIGGLSGKSIKPVALRCVYEISKKIGLPVIGCGGIFDWRDAIEFIMAGASAVQIGSAIRYYGMDCFDDIKKGIIMYLERKGYRNIQDLIGFAHRY